MARCLRLLGWTSALALWSGVAFAAGPFVYHSVTPCRLLDTRSPGPIVGPVAAGTQASFTARGVCGIPAGAAAISINTTVIVPSQDGFLTIWPADQSLPLFSNINFARNEPALGNGAIVPLGAERRTRRSWSGWRSPATLTT